MSSPYLSKDFVNGVYIPSGILIVGCLIAKQDWLPYAVVVALVLGGIKVFTNGTSWNSQPKYAPKHLTDNGSRSQASSQARRVPEF